MFTAEWWKELREGKVFVDFNQNAPHKNVFGVGRPAAPGPRCRRRSSGTS
ncbi:MAG: hypothetical protein R2697_03745 [Ilumatobacteraceae bacterium]